MKMIDDFAQAIAFRYMLAMSEGTRTSPLTKADGYDVIVTGVDGPEVFTDFKQHPFTHRPAKLINKNGLLSTASGRYQILLRYWQIEQAQNGWPTFERVYQDQYVFTQLVERGALSWLKQGDIVKTIQLVNGLWASLPGKQYVGQGQHTLTQCVTWYQAAMAANPKP